MRLVLAGIPDHLASTLRSGHDELDRTTAADETIRTLQRSPAPRLLVVSETLPGAGDVLAAVEADCRLAALVLVVVVGDRSALAVALPRRGVAVLGSRGAGRRLRRMAREQAPPSQPARERLLCLLRERTDSSERHVTRSRGLIERSHQLCALSRGGAV